MLLFNILTYHDDGGDATPVENVEDFPPPSRMRPSHVYVRCRPSPSSGPDEQGNVAGTSDVGGQQIEMWYPLFHDPYSGYRPHRPPDNQYGQPEPKQQSSESGS
eukprot:TRINITY_DN8430_c2_g1_i1.p1 TRINITY_DN8430_c2_g1~~TRINITY_DN8430_c2_g1_i1.p1  ORF type:complete len:104 (+),score=16.94 TRINITY_DN8430_c2_g1_i1:83-394(+)